MNVKDNAGEINIKIKKQFNVTIVRGNFHE